MANQKQVQKRHFILDHCLRDNLHEYTLDDLLNTVNTALAEMGMRPVSERQLYNDISYLQSEDGYGAELDTYRIVRTDESGRNRSYVAYRYKDPNYSIKNMRLPELQLRFLRAVSNSMLNFSGLPQQEWLASHYNKLQESFDGLAMDKCVMMDVNPYIGGAKAKEWILIFEKVLMAIFDHQALDVIVDTSAHGIIKGCFHPVFLRQYNRRWYAMGVMSQDLKKVMALPIDLMQIISISKEPYYKYPFNPNEYFDDIIGVFDPGTPTMDVHLRFYGWAGKHLEFNPLHGSQRSHWEIVDGERVLDVHLEVKHNIELENLLMGFVGVMDVLGPEELVRRHREALIWACKKKGIKLAEDK